MPWSRLEASNASPQAVDGKLKIRFIPLTANGRTPDTSDAVLDVYREYLLAMYPVDEVEFTVAEPVSVAYPVSWNRVLDQLRALRQLLHHAVELRRAGLVDLLCVVQSVDRPASLVNREDVPGTVKTPVE